MQKQLERKSNSQKPGPRGAEIGRFYAFIGEEAAKED